MRVALVLWVLALSPGLAGAAEITRYATRLEVEPDGSGHALSTLVVAGRPSETLEVPLGRGAWANLRLTEAPEGLRLEPPAAGATTVRVTLPASLAAATTAPTAPAAPTAPTAPAARFAFAFDVPEAFARPEDPSAGSRLTIPAESRTLRYTFVNTQASPIGDFTTLVVLPAGYRFEAIREQLPGPKRSEVEPRVRLGASDGRQDALLHLENLRQGDSTSMALEALPGRRSLAWLLVGTVLSALYLVRFRDLVARNADPTKT